MESGFITNMQLSEALIRQKSGGGAKRMGDVLIEMGLLTQEKLEAALKKQQESAIRMGGMGRPGIAPSVAAPRPSPAQSFYGGGAAPSPRPPQAVPQFQQQSFPPGYQQPQPQPAAQQTRESKGHLALVQLLIKKGIISMEEYFQEVQGR